MLDFIIIRGSDFGMTVEDSTGHLSWDDVDTMRAWIALPGRKPGDHLTLDYAVVVVITQDQDKQDQNKQDQVARLIAAVQTAEAFLEEAADWIANSGADESDEYTRLHAAFAALQAAGDVPGLQGYES